MGFIAGFIPAAAAGTIGWIRWLHELREKRREKEGRVGIEKELEEIRRRGLGPYLRATYLSAPSFPEHGNQVVRPGTELDPVTPAGLRLTLHIANTGAPARELNDDWPPSSGFDIRHDLPHDQDHAISLSYPFEPEKKGQVIRIRLDFETLEGLKLHHINETRHG